jgi:alkylation response protein AidB-like acyl-CoA dehydrogenase
VKTEPKPTPSRESESAGPEVEEEFRRDVREWLRRSGLQPARKDRAVSQSASFPDGDEFVQAARSWQKQLDTAGLAAISWPEAYGGRSASPTMASILREELEEYDTPPNVSDIGIEMLAPAILAHGTEEQKQRYLGAMRDGSEIWCQLWSEPGAGSDLGSLRSTAIVERTPGGDAFRVNGQKVWTSGAHYSRWGLGLFRSDPSIAGTRGVSCLIIDMQAKGVSIRPLKQMTGHAHFSEVFFDDVMVPWACLVGDLHGGWTVARTTMAAERQTVASMTSSPYSINALITLARSIAYGGGRASDNPSVRQALAQAYIRFRVLSASVTRYRRNVENGTALVAEASVIKLLGAQLESEVAEIGFRLCGMGGTVMGSDGVEGGRWADVVLASFSHHLGGGTDEIQKNAIGEVLLGLPREPRP